MIIDELREALRKNSDEETRISGQRYFKEEVRLYGIRASVVTAISKEFFAKLPSGNKAHVFDLCESLWQSGYWEESLIACNWAYDLRREFRPDDFPRFAKWVETYVDNWASCDTLCNHTIGTMVEKFPQFISELKEWARSKNRWVRRAAAVTLIVPARKGLFIGDIFEIAEILLNDKDDMVQKGYGWMLKVASQRHQREVFDFIMKRKMMMPRTALRYAIEKMPDELRRKAMER